MERCFGLFWGLQRKSSWFHVYLWYHESMSLWWKQKDREVQTIAKQGFQNYKKEHVFLSLLSLPLFLPFPHDEAKTRGSIGCPPFSVCTVGSLKLTPFTAHAGIPLGERQAWHRQTVTTG